MKRSGGPQTFARRPAWWCLAYGLRSSIRWHPRGVQQDTKRCSHLRLQEAGTSSSGALTQQVWLVQQVGRGRGIGREALSVRHRHSGYLFHSSSINCVILIVPSPPVCCSTATAAPFTMPSTAAGCGSSSAWTARPTCALCCSPRGCAVPGSLWAACVVARHTSATCSAMRGFALASSEGCAFGCTLSLRRTLRLRLPTCMPTMCCTVT